MADNKMIGYFLIQENKRVLALFWLVFVMVALTGIKRAGADGIMTYYALQAAVWIRAKN